MLPVRGAPPTSVGSRPSSSPGSPRRSPAARRGNAGRLRESGADIRAFDASLFAESVDDEETNRKLPESLGLDHPILTDSGEETPKAHRVLTAARHASRWTFSIGADGKILDVDEQVGPDTAGEDVAARRAELGVARRKSSPVSSADEPSGGPRCFGRRAHPLPPGRNGPMPDLDGPGPRTESQTEHCSACRLAAAGPAG